MTELEVSEGCVSHGSPMTAFTTAAFAIGCLYQATGSLDVTLAGAAISAMLAGWAMWLHHRAVDLDAPGQPVQSLEQEPGKITGLRKTENRATQRGPVS